jgi:hypothetical protein
MKCQGMESSSTFDYVMVHMQRMYIKMYLTFRLNGDDNEINRFFNDKSEIGNMNDNMLTQ